MTASASRDEISNEAFSFLSKIHGNSVFVISWLNHLEVEGEGRPSESKVGSQLPVPVRSELACALTLGASSIDVLRTAHGKCRV